MITQQHLVDLASLLVAIPSVTGNEQMLSKWMADHFASIGLVDVRRLPVSEAGDTVVGWVDGPADGPTLLFCFHMDTFAVFDGWTTDPFVPTLIDDRLYGLGAHDMKGGAACALGAVESLVKSKTRLRGRILVAATTDEENWSRGVHAVIRSGLMDGCIGCLIPEPSPLATLTVGARGRHVFRISFQGKSVHAAYGGGINAAVDAARTVVALSTPGSIDLGFSTEFGLSGSLCTIGVHSGSDLIVVPEHAEVIVDRHILPGQTVEEAAAQIRTVLTGAGIVGSYRLTWDERPTPAPAPYVVAPDHPLVRAAQAALESELGGKIRPVLARSVADTNHLAVHGGVPTLICGPQGGNTCEADEYVLVDSLLPVARTYVETAKRVLDPSA